MTDCSNVDMREVLPEFLHGKLDGMALGRVQAHLDLCSDCTAELAVLRAVCSTAPATWVDVERIAAAIPPYRQRKKLDVVYLRLAAAFLIAAVGVSAIAVTHQRRSVYLPETGGQAVTTSPGLAIVDISDLSDDHLAQLISDMDHLEAAPPLDPDPALSLSTGGA
jgi:hypothetical protein